MSKLIGTDSLIRKLNKIKEMKIRNVIEKATIKVRDEARNRVPVDTAELRLSIHHRIENKGNGKYVGIVFTNKEYAPYVEFGTGPVGHSNHDGISPEVKPMYSPEPWVYYDETLQRFVYTKGYMARPFMYPALHDNKDKIKKFIIKSLKEELKEARR